MCGRYTLKTRKRIIRERFQLAEDPPEWVARYNLAPSQDGLVIREDPTDHSRHASILRWGLIPAWTKAGSTRLPSLINARSESADRKPAFRDSFRQRRCLVVADGFYEWETRGRSKWPIRFSLSDEAPFAMAGLWDRWYPPHDNDQTTDSFANSDAIESFTILTTTANDLVAGIHDRMPVIIHPKHYGDWLDNATPAASLHRLFTPFNPAEMAAIPANPDLNRIDFDSPDCLTPPKAGKIQLEFEL